jgi:hypothetical protein
MINQTRARHVTDCHYIHALSRRLLHNIPSSTALTSQRTQPVTRHKNGFLNIHAVPHNVFYPSFLHSRANQALLSNFRMLISCYAMLYVLCAQLFPLLRRVPYEVCPQYPWQPCSICSSFLCLFSYFIENTANGNRGKQGATLYTI